GPTPTASNDNSNAEVPESTPRQNGAPIAAANSASKPLFSGPRMNAPESITRLTASLISPARASFCALMERRGMFVAIALMSVRSFAERHDVRGLQDDLEVHAEGPVLDVVQVEGKALLAGDVGTARHLPEPGDAGQEVGALLGRLSEVALQRLDLARRQRQRARADDAHLAAQDVEELRELVEREPPQELAHARHARVVLRLEEGALRVVEALHVGDALLGVGDHGAELEGVEDLALVAVALLREQDRPRRVELDQHADHEPERRGDGEQDRREHRVERALGQEV